VVVLKAAVKIVIDIETADRQISSTIFLGQHRGIFAIGPEADVIIAPMNVRFRGDCVAKLENTASAKFSRKRANQQSSSEIPY